MILHGTCGVSHAHLNCGTMNPFPNNRHTKVNESDHFWAICLQNVLCAIMVTP